jgi:hypothetical protein
LWKVLVLLSRTASYTTDEGSDPKVNKDAKKALLGDTTRGIHGPQKILKIRCPRLAKNAFAIQNLLHYSIVYTITHYCTIKMDALIIAFLRSYPTVQVTFFLLVRIFALNFSFYLLKCFGQIFSGNSENLLGLMVPWSDTFSTPWCVVKLANSEKAEIRLFEIADSPPPPPPHSLPSPSSKLVRVK